MLNLREVREVGGPVSGHHVVGPTTIGDDFDHDQNAVLPVLKNPSEIRLFNDRNGLLVIIDRLSNEWGLHEKCETQNSD